MSQEMKLLEALCDALGFEVERMLDYQEQKIPPHQHCSRNLGFGEKVSRASVTDGTGKYITDKNGFYTSRLITPIVDFKLRAK